MGDSSQHQLDQRLHQAAEQRDVAAATRALDDGADPNNGLEPDSVLMRAVDGDYTFLDTPQLTALIELLVSRGADPDGQIPGHEPADAPIHTAAAFGMVDALTALHRGGADINRLSDERMTALGTAECEHWFRVAALLGDDYFGGVLPRTLEELPARFRHPADGDDNARFVHFTWGVQQVIPYLRANGGLIEWELLPAITELVDTVWFAPESPCRYYRPGIIEAKRNHHPLAPEAFEALPVALQDDYEAWCAQLVDPWLHGPGSPQVLAFDYDEYADRGLRLLAEFMGRLAMPQLGASIGLHSSAAIAAGSHLRDYYDWSWPRRTFIKRVSWRDVPYRSLLDVE